MKSIGAMLALLMIPTCGFAEVKLGTREVLLDNEQVEVVRLTYPVGTESGMHGHSYANRVAYVVKGGQLELIPEDPKKHPEVLTVSEGKALFLPASTHNVKNIGDTEVVIIETELK
jgi:quercetin dioxygenase-like cupin family protein